MFSSYQCILHCWIIGQSLMLHTSTHAQIDHCAVQWDPIFHRQTSDIFHFFTPLPTQFGTLLPFFPNLATPCLPMFTHALTFLPISGSATPQNPWENVRRPRADSAGNPAAEAPPRWRPRWRPAPHSASRCPPLLRSRWPRPSSAPAPLTQCQMDPTKMGSVDIYMYRWV